MPNVAFTSPDLGVFCPLKVVVIDRVFEARITAGRLDAWNTPSDAILALGQELLINDPTPFDWVRVLGVDEHVWSHSRRGGTYVAIVIGLASIRDGTGYCRLLDMVPGRSKRGSMTWLGGQIAEFRDAVEVVAKDGLTGHKTATAGDLPEATAVMDPLHVVALAGEKVDQCRQGVQQVTLGHRGRSGSALHDSECAAHRC